MNIETDIPLAPLITFKIGGRAKFFACAKSVEDIREALRFVRGELPPLPLGEGGGEGPGTKLFVLGGGSNTLFSDSGFNGLVLKIELRGIEFRGDLLIASAGEFWDDVVAESARRNLHGLENLSGIPGTVGAAPVQNIGAYGAEVADTIAWVEVLDTRDDTIKIFSREACAFEYRTSVFKKESPRYVILRVAFRLSEKNAPNLSYKDLREAFANDAAPTPQQIHEKILAIRAEKFPDLAREGTAGSFFLNPIVSASEATRIAVFLPGVPQFPQPDGSVKVSLAYMLDKGLGLKGFRIGAARLFEKQPLVMVADFGASSRDVQTLCEEVQKKVFDAYEISIEPEVRMIS